MSVNHVGAGDVGAVAARNTERGQVVAAEAGDFVDHGEPLLRGLPQ